MSNKNTLENKARFFAQYHGQRIVWFNEECEQTGICSADLSVITDSHLELKPLSSISDEQAIEVAKILTRGFTNIPEKFNYALHGRLFVNDAEKRYYKDAIIEVNDYLRSQSFLLPFDGITVEELQEWGWAKIKES